MLSRSRPSILAPFAFALAVAPACDSNEASTAASFEDQEVIADFADEVVVPTYELLAARAVLLKTAVAALVASPDAAKLTAARDAWVAARAPWEQSEGFLFGPVDSFGIDPALDSWPLNETDLNAVLSGQDALTPAYVSSLDNSQKGFHTLEYLLFGVDGTRTPAELGARELAYLDAIASDFVTLTDRLAKSWTTGDAQLTVKYRDLFASAGQAGNQAYPSLSAAAQEIVNGMIGICDEVAKGKIADPLDNRDPLLEESQFSHNSLIDFQNNIRSIQNAYTGRVPDAGTSGRGLSDWVASKNPTLDAKVKAHITAAIDAVGAIPAPFATAILDNAKRPTIVAAQEAITALQTVLEQELLPLVQ